jgi:CHAT domain-containing protein
MAREQRSLQDLIQNRQRSGFVGRQSQVTQFVENLALEVDDERRRFLFNIHGDAGVGKTYLTMQLRHAAAERGAKAAYLDDTVEDLFSAMSMMARGLGPGGDWMREFSKRADAYVQRRHELASDPDAPDGVAAFLTKTAVMIGLQAARDVPIAGSLLAPVDTQSVADQANRARTYLAGKFRDHADVRLLLSPAEELTPLFVSGLRRAAAEAGTVILFIDTYERTGLLLDQWLRDMYAGRYGQLPSTLVTTISGQAPLDPNSWSAYLPVIADVPLEPFSDTEARQFLASKDITGEHTVELVLKLSGRLPLWLATLASGRPGTAADVGDPADDLVGRFLKWEGDPVRRAIAVTAALPRTVNRDILTYLAPDGQAPALFAWLRSMPFVVQQGGTWRYHEVARAAMLRLQRNQAPSEWRSRHIALARAHANWAAATVADTNTRWSNPDWIDHAREETYHLLCADPANNLPQALASAVKAAAQSASRAWQWAGLISDAGADSDQPALREWGKLLGDGIHDRDITEYLSLLISKAQLDKDSLLLALRERSNGHRLAGRFAEALDDFNRIIEMDSQLNASVMSGFEAGDRADANSELIVIYSLINKLYDLTSTSLPDSPETIAQWQQMADDCIARARAFGQPVVLALALHADVQVKLAADDYEAAAALLEEEYRQVAGVEGKAAVNQAIMALTFLAKLQLVTSRNFKAAAETAAKAIELVERDRYRVSVPFQQAALLAPHADLFTAGVFSAWQIATGGTAPGPGGYDLMLQLMELSKARASVRELYFAQAAGTIEYDKKLSTLNNAIHAHDTVVGPTESAEERERGREQERQAEQSLRQQRLQLWDLRANTRRDPDAKLPPVTLAGLQAALEPDEAIIYYYWLNSSVLLVVTITATAIAAERKLLGPDQRSLMESLSEALGSRPDRDLEATFIEPLASVLAPVEGQPLLEGKQRLIVSPHRWLHWYPFAAMPYQGQPLVGSFAIRYAPNLTSLLVPPLVPGAPRMAAVAVSHFPGRQELGELRGVRAEAADIIAIYSAAKIPADLMAEPTRGDALAAMRNGRLNGAWCLHLATHGYSLMDGISRHAPLESVLELAEQSVDGYEIAAANLGCEIVVLTACYAGQRDIEGRGVAEQPGDELFGLTAAFLNARCRSVLAPTWRTDDECTSRIITAFHRNLAMGAPADIALARAQRAFLQTALSKQRSACYWAPLTLTTIGRPISIPGTPTSLH